MDFYKKMKQTADQAQGMARQDTVYTHNWFLFLYTFTALFLFMLVPLQIP